MVRVQRNVPAGQFDNGAPKYIMLKDCDFYFGEHALWVPVFIGMTSLNNYQYKTFFFKKPDTSAPVFHFLSSRQSAVRDGSGG
jgi:hypothetical protein